MKSYVFASAAVLISSLWLAAVNAAHAEVQMPTAITELVGEGLYKQALAAKSAASDHVKNDQYMTVIDYRLPSGTPRFYLINLADKTAMSLLVAHGKGSDPDHDGMANKFSNIEGSKMSSLGSFITGDTYTGQHGLSLRLHGLDPQNDRAEERFIVIHGASYVNSGRKILGRSWGCPALEKQIALDVIPLIKGGSFIYAIGQS